MLLPLIPAHQLTIAAPSIHLEHSGIGGFFAMVSWEWHDLRPEHFLVLGARAPTSAAALRAQRTAAVGGPRLSYRFQRTRAHRTYADLRLLTDLALSTPDRSLTATMCATSLCAQIDS